MMLSHVQVLLLKTKKKKKKKKNKTEGNFTQKHIIEVHKDYIKTVYFIFKLGSNASHNKRIHVCGR